MTVNDAWAGMAVAGVAIIVAIFTMLRYRNVPMTREQLLEVSVRDLEATVRTLQRDHVQDQQRITQLEHELSEARERIRVLEMQLELSGAKPPKAHAGDTLLVAMGDEDATRETLAALREVEARSGMRISRLKPVSKVNLKRILDQNRRQGAPIRYVHFVGHSGEKGLVFSDGIADGAWLSEQLAGVEIAVLAGCENDAVGDLLGIVPVVVTMNEKLPFRDAWQFAVVWWQAIGEGLTPSAAWQRCEERCPVALMEYANLRAWGR